MNRATCYSTLIIAIVALGIAIWQMVAAPFADDFAYQMTVLPTCDNDFWDLVGEPIEGFGDAAVSAWNHWRLVNGRLSNILMIFSVLMPQWVVDMMHGLIVGLMLWLIVRCIAPRRAMSYTWVVGVIALVMWKYFPWSDTMVLSAFLFNYPWSCVAALAYSYIFLYADKKRKTYPLVIALIAGWMHEGFSIPLVCASVVSLPFVPKELRRHRIAMIIALAVGAALCALAPSTLMRLERSESKNLLSAMLRTFSRSYPVYIYMYISDSGVYLWMAKVAERAETKYILDCCVYCKYYDGGGVSRSVESYVVSKCGFADIHTFDYGQLLRMVSKTTLFYRLNSNADNGGVYGGINQMAA